MPTDHWTIILFRRTNYNRSCRVSRAVRRYHHPSILYSYALHTDAGKIPLVIVACGSYSPVTYLHLRMFVMAQDDLQEKGQYEIIGGYFSPVADAYGKKGLAEARHRVRMCELATHWSEWIMIDSWEARKPQFVRTALVLDHFHEELNEKRGGVMTTDGQRKRIKIMLLAGGDLMESFGTPGVWSDEDLHHILGEYGCIIVERTGADVWSFLLEHDILHQHRKNVIVVKQLIHNDISSTKIRLFVKRGMTIKFLLPNSVIQYIKDYRLYLT